MTDYEAWRPAVAAFYRAEGWLQMAENVERGWELPAGFERTAEALQRAFRVAPVQVQQRRAA